MSCLLSQTRWKCLLWFDRAGCAPALQGGPLGVGLLATKLSLLGLTDGIQRQSFIALIYSELNVNEPSLHKNKTVYFVLSTAAL